MATMSARNCGKFRCLLSSLFLDDAHIYKPIRVLTTKAIRNIERMPCQEENRRWLVGKCTFVRCWNCKVDVENINAVTCLRCNVLLPPTTTASYFRVFGIPDSYDVDLTDLARRFRDLQKRFHPDKYARKDEVEQEYSLQYSSVLNAGYQTLCNPYERGVHLLALKGDQLEEMEIIMDHEFLMKILEINEELADDTSPQRLQTIKVNTEQIMNRVSIKISAAFRNKDFAAAKMALSEMKYHVNVMNKIKEIERDRGVVH